MKGQKGFSLVQLLIVAGMLSGIFVVSLKIMKNQNKMGKSSSEEFEITYLFDDIRNLMADPSLCKETLKSVNPFEPSDLEGIKGDLTSNEFAYQAFDKAGKKYGQNNLKIKSIEYLVGDQEASVEDGEAFLKLVFEKSKSALGKKEVEKRMKVHLVLSENKKISSCFSLPGVNFQENEEVVEKKNHWYPVSGTENVYTNKSLVKVNSSKSFGSPGLAIAGKVKISGDSQPCNTERLGTLKYEQNKLVVCKANGQWHDVWNPAQSVMSKSFLLKAKRTDKVERTKRPFNFCTISTNELYGARCLTKRLGGNLWELSLLYDRGEESKCSFLCYSLR